MRLEARRLFIQVLVGGQSRYVAVLGCRDSSSTVCMLLCGQTSRAAGSWRMWMLLWNVDRDLRSWTASLGILLLAHYGPSSAVGGGHGPVETDPIRVSSRWASELADGCPLDSTEDYRPIRENESRSIRQFRQSAMRMTLLTASTAHRGSLSIRDRQLDVEREMPCQA